MARYIDSKYLVDWCNEMYQKQTQIKGKEYCNAFLQTVVTAPTADVAPKSEVARKIFGEIEEIFNKRIAFYTDMKNQSVFNEKKYAETMIANCTIYLKEIAELKKKYTEN